MEILLGLAVAAGVLLAGRRLLLVVTVRGSSMEPTYYEGDRVLVLRMRRLATCRPGVVVIFAQMRAAGVADFSPSPGYAGPPLPTTRWVIKRVVARPGESTPDAVPVEPRGGAVPAGSLVVYGDNVGHDSRSFGYLPLKRVRGVVIADLSTRWTREAVIRR